MKLIHSVTLNEVHIGDGVTDIDGEIYEVGGFIEPHKPSSTGRVIVKQQLSEKMSHTMEYFPSVFNLKFI